MDEAAPLLALLLLFGLGGKKKEEPTPEVCPPRSRWDAELGRCVVGACLPPNMLDRNGRCITMDGPIVEPPPPVIDPDPTDIDELVDDYPTDGKLFQVSSGYIFSGVPSASNGKRILYNAVAQRAFLVARDELGMSEAAASTWARDVARNQENRAAMMRGIMREPWNDQLYGTFGYKSGVASPDACTKRAIRLLPQNADNVDRLRSNQAPIRSIQFGSPNAAGNGNAYAAPGAPTGHLELLWINPIDVDHLKATKQVRILMTGPPEWIRELGIENRSNAPAGTVWGC